MSLLPPDDDLDLLHTRDYETRVYQLSDRELLVRGVVSDCKPPGLYVESDPDPLEMHQMQLELQVSLPDLTITRARVLFETHPHGNCPRIADDYEKLVGLSIARGFNHKIRDLFGGPKGCTHTNALLQAMAPAVVQSTWSLSVRRSRAGNESPGTRNPAERDKRIAANTNTCHIWSEDGEHIAALRRGDRSGVAPLPVRDRLQKLGLDKEHWN
ncbi:MAG: DUF2889 domain-containing protein [Deltaproteobacteria bacterium]|nr:DUF2889 domain-containing protein [Deltaproteobacteria bacterium]